jgi:hypothetical protein
VLILRNYFTNLILTLLTSLILHIVLLHLLYLLTYVLLTCLLTHSLTYLLAYLLSYILTHSLTSLLTCLLIYILTYLLNTWSRVLETLTVSQPVKKFPALHGIRRFVTVTRALHLTLSCTAPPLPYNYENTLKGKQPLCSIIEHYQ